MPVTRIRQGAGLVSAENTITISHYYPVNPIAQNLSQQSSGPCQTPETFKLRQHVDDSVGARQHSLAGLTVINHDVKRVQVTRICPMPLKQSCRKIALQGCKAKLVVGVALQQELIQTVAEPANAIVKHDRVGAGFRHSTSNSYFAEQCQGGAPFEKR